MIIVMVIMGIIGERIIMIIMMIIMMIIIIMIAFYDNDFTIYVNDNNDTDYRNNDI